MGVDALILNWGKASNTLFLLFGFCLFFMLRYPALTRKVDKIWDYILHIKRTRKSDISHLSVMDKRYQINTILAIIFGYFLKKEISHVGFLHLHNGIKDEFGNNQPDKLSMNCSFSYNLDIQGDCQEVPLEKFKDKIILAKEQGGFISVYQDYKDSREFKTEMLIHKWEQQTYYLYEINGVPAFLLKLSFQKLNELDEIEKHFIQSNAELITSILTNKIPNSFRNVIE